MIVRQRLVLVAIDVVRQDEHTNRIPELGIKVKDCIYFINAPNDIDMTDKSKLIKCYLL